MGTRLCAAAILLATSVAGAQPGLQPPSAYQPQLDDDRELEITRGQHLGGGVAAVMIGFGTGQAIQGRWHDTGWIYTLGESLSFVPLMAGILELGLPHGPCSACSHDQVNTPILVGLIGYSIFHAAEIVDAFAAPPIHNRHVRAARARAGVVAPYVLPLHGTETGAIAGIAASF